MLFFAPQRASWRRTPKRRRPRSPSYSEGSRRLLHPSSGPPRAPLPPCRLRRRERGSAAAVGPHKLQAPLHLLPPSGAPPRLHALSGLGEPSRRSRGGRPPSSTSRPCTSPPSGKGRPRKGRPDGRGRQGARFADMSHRGGAAGSEEPPTKIDSPPTVGRKGMSSAWFLRWPRGRPPARAPVSWGLAGSAEKGADPPADGQGAGELLPPTVRRRAQELLLRPPVVAARRSSSSARRELELELLRRRREGGREREGRRRRM
jgi:hypothetical protein